MHLGAAHGPPRACRRGCGGGRQGGGNLPQGRKPDGRTLPLSGALSGGQQDLYNFPKMKWQTCGKHSES